MPGRRKGVLPLQEANRFAKCCRGQVGKTSKRFYLVEEEDSESDVLHVEMYNDEVGVAAAVSAMTVGGGV